MVTQFYIIGKQSGESGVDIKEMKKHINFKYIQWGYDYLKGYEPILKKYVDAVNCDREKHFA